jgi:hypothetical protein
MADTTDDRCYVAIRPCGCLGMATTASAYASDAGTRRELASCVRLAWALDRMPVEAVRAARWSCDTCTPPKEAPGLFAPAAAL